MYLGLGSNLGNKEQHIRGAIEKIHELIGDVVSQSALYVTEPWGFDSENLFVNAVVCCHTELSPREVLRLTQQIERSMGRKKKFNCNLSNRKYKDRPIDIDILLYDDLTVDEPDLKIPHPLMYERDFVMKPLAEIRKEERGERRVEREKKGKDRK